MTNTANIREHMEVVGSDGQHVGTVDHLEGETIKLTRGDPNANGQHHYVPVGWVERVDDTVHLNKPARDAMMEWQGVASESRR